MLGRSRRKTNSAPPVVLVDPDRYDSPAEQRIAAARAAYLNSNPSDPCATVAFLMAVDAADKPQVCGGGEADVPSVAHTVCSLGHNLPANHYIHPERFACGCPRLDPGKNPGWRWSRTEGWQAPRDLCARCGAHYVGGHGLTRDGLCCLCDDARKGRRGCSRCDTVQQVGTGDRFKVCSGDCKQFDPFDQSTLDGVMQELLAIKNAMPPAVVLDNSDPMP